MPVMRLLWLIATLMVLAGFAGTAHAQSTDPADQVCQRFVPGSVLPVPPDLRSQNGVLEVSLHFKTALDQQGLMRFCYVTDDGLQSPTLHVLPGDQLIIHFYNDVPAGSGPPPASLLKMHARHASDGPNNDCIGGAMGPTVTNLHFHGLNVAPTCHQDEVINTLVQPTESFDYTVQIPADEPTGLYWYHPHPHGFSAGQVLGGAAGALIVDGIENVSPMVAGLPQRLFVFRDQMLPGAAPYPPGPSGPAFDLSLNYVPVPSPTYTPVTVQTAAGVPEFWRALNASANTQLQLQYVVDGVAQPLQLIALDGVPIGQGTGAIQSVTQTSITLGPGARAEFVAVTPKIGQQGQLLTQAVNTGPIGAPTPLRPLANIVAQSGTVPAAARLGAQRTAVRVTRFASLSAAAPNGRRLLYFSESPGPNPAFFITVQGQTPVAYEMGAPPSIVLHQGTTEEWTVENRTLEDHVFHIHQTRFQTLAINGQPLSDPALRDTITVSHWSGSGAYPSVKLQMDFRPANIVGTFVYHCHILSHEDLGMMAAIQVLPTSIATTTTVTATRTETSLDSPLTFTATVAPASSGTAPTGSVQFFDGDAPLGTAVMLTGTSASLTTPLNSYGSHLVSATYSGDSTHNQSLSATVTVAVEDFALSASPLKVTRGQSGSVPVAVTTSSGFTSTVDLKCSLPATLTGASCQLTPASVSGPGTVTLLVSTTSSATASLYTALSTGLAGIVLLAVPWRRRRLLAWLLLCALTLGACGGSQHADSGTPTGNFSLTLSGACGGDAAPITHTISVPLQIL